MKSILEQNIDKIHELVPEAHWAGVMFVNECFDLNYRFRISEAYRTPERQKALYAQGRTKPGPVVTWTLQSNHIKRLAVDLYPIFSINDKNKLDAFYRDIDSVANKYGIFRDPALIKIGDFGHYDFNKAIPRPKPNIPKSKSAALRKLEREASQSKSPRKERLEARKKRIISH